MKGEREDKPSKTRRKRDAQAMQELGEALANLPGEALAGLGLPDRLCQALEEYGRLSSHEARRRQRQFIGRLMRDVDPGPLQAFLRARQRPGQEEARLFHLAERWRDRLIAEGDATLHAFLACHPAADPAALHEAVMAAREGRSGASRRLFRMTRSILADLPGTSQRRDALLE
jgi:ribosome-associated protein